MCERILQTERLALRKLDNGDFENLCTILQDEKAMYAYEHAFSDAEVRQWLRRQIDRYVRDGFGLWAVILKETGAFVGQCGLTLQEYGETQVVEVGYLFARSGIVATQPRRLRLAGTMRLKQLAPTRCSRSSARRTRRLNALPSETA